MRPWPETPRVYEINTRVWLAELAARYGRHLTLDQIPDVDLDGIRRLGFHAVWLMGVWNVGRAPVASSRQPARLEEYRRVLPDLQPEDAIGSPYAVSAYEVDRSLGGDAAMRALRDRLARRGVGLVLDFVSNHTAVDHPLLSTHPAAYITGTTTDLKESPEAFFKASTGAIVAHGRDPHFPPWTDTAQLHYGHAAARQSMMQTLARIADRCDGVRCDMAMLLLPDVMEKVWGARLGAGWIRKSFWGEAIAYVRARRSDFVFLAEVYWGLEGRLQAEGFDFTYDKSLYDHLRVRDARAVRRHLERPLEPQRYDVRFIENHDEPRAAVQFGTLAGAAAAVAYLSPGMKLFHEGQLEGRKVRVPVQLRRRPVETADPPTQELYRRLLEILRDPAFVEGTFTPVAAQASHAGDLSHESFVAFHRRGPAVAAADRGWLVVVNLGTERGTARLRLTIPLDPAHVYSFDDRLNGVRYDRQGAELSEAGLFVALEPGGVHVFRISG